MSLCRSTSPVCHTAPAHVAPRGQSSAHRLTTSNCENYRLSTTKTTTFFLYGVRLRMELALPGRRLLRPENVVVRDLEKLLEFRHLLLVRSWPLKLQDDVLSAPPRLVAADGPHDLVEFHELSW